MSEQYKKTLADYCNDVIELKKELMEYLKNNDKKQCIEIIKKMRIIHGKTIIDAEKYKLAIIDKKIVDEFDWIKLSTNQSFLVIIHKTIRQCEKNVYDKSNNTRSEFANLTTSDSIESDKLSDKINNLSTTSASAKSYRSLKNVDVGDEEIISLDLSQSDTENSLKITDLKLTDTKYNEKEPAKRCRLERTNEDYLGEKVISENKYIFNGLDIRKPTVVNFWASWCSYSNKFLPEWEKLKQCVLKEYPEVQITDLDVGNDRKLNEYAQEAGVNGYPTIVFFINKRKYSLVAGNKTKLDVEKFISNILNKEKCS